MLPPCGWVDISNLKSLLSLYFYININCDIIYINIKPQNGNARLLKRFSAIDSSSLDAYQPLIWKTGQKKHSQVTTYRFASLSLVSEVYHTWIFFPSLSVYCHPVIQFSSLPPCHPVQFIAILLFRPSYQTVKIKTDCQFSLSRVSPYRGSDRNLTFDLCSHHSLSGTKTLWSAKVRPILNSAQMGLSLFNYARQLSHS